MKGYSRAIIAAVVFLLLLAWTVTNERGRAPEKGEAFGIDAKTATRLDVKTESGSLILEKQGEQWVMTAPQKGWADKDLAERMVKAIAELRPSGSRKGEQLTDARYGLDKPGMTVTLTYGRGKTVTVAIGKATPGAGEYFARIEGRDALYFVPGSLRTDLAQLPANLLDRNLMRVDKEKVTSVVLQFADRVISFNKQGEGDKTQWQMTQPSSVRADEYLCKNIIDRLTALKADSFAPLPAPAGQDYGLTKPRVQATLKTTDGKQYVVLLGGTTTQTVPAGAPPQEGLPPAGQTRELIYAQLQGRDEVLLVGGSVWLDVNKTAMDLRDKRIARFTPDQVQEIRVERKTGFSFTASRTSDGWALTVPSARRAKTQKVDEALWDVSELEAKEFLGTNQDLRTAGLAVPQTVITITLKGRQPLRVMIGEPKGEGTYYAMTSDSKEVYVIGSMLLNDLPKGEADIKETGTPAGSTPTSPSPAVPAPSS